MERKAINYFYPSIDFWYFLKGLFKYPNKNIKNNLKEKYIIKQIEDPQINVNIKKPINLTLKEVILLYQALKRRNDV